MKHILVRKYLKWIIIIVLFIFIGGVIFFTQNNSNTIEEAGNDLEEMANETSEVVAKEKGIDEQSVEHSLYVDVKGAVKSEGVYEVHASDRVIDVIKQAGGFTEHADIKKVNLAALLKDEMVVYIPEVGENNDNILIEVAGNQTENKKMNINQANQADLETLPGIGPSKATAILSYRDEHGLFQKIEDIMNVTGIGKSTFEHLKEVIDVN